VIGSLGVVGPYGLAFIPGYQLDISKSGTGSGVVWSDPSGIHCGLTCSYEFNVNAAVTLHASADDGSEFTGWSGGGCAIIDIDIQACTVTMTEAKSITANFAGHPGEVTLIAPSGAISSNQPSYAWNADVAASWYYLWVSKVNNDGSLTTVHTKWYDASLVCSGATCSITPSGITLSAGNYGWWIQTWNDGGYGLWSSAMNFSLPVIPPPGVATLVSPNGSIADTTPDYTWNKVNDSTWYYLWISRVNGDGSLTTIHTKWYDASLVCSGAPCTITPAGVTLTSGNYRWWIQTWNDGGYGLWSSRMDFSLP